MSKRQIRLFLIIGIVYSAIINVNLGQTNNGKPEALSLDGGETKKMKRTDSEWKRILSSAEYHILREKGTERAFTGEYDGHFEEGIYVCAGCGHDLFN